MTNEEMLNEIKKTVKEEVSAGKEELKLHTSVLQEQLVKEVRTVAEGHSVMQNEMKRGFDEVKEEIRDVKTAVKHLAEKVEVHDKKIASL